MTGCFSHDICRCGGTADSSKQAREPACSKVWGKYLWARHTSMRAKRLLAVGAGEAGERSEIRQYQMGIARACSGSATILAGRERTAYPEDPIDEYGWC